MLIVVIEAVTEDAGTASRLLAEARPLIAKTRAEPGCITYGFSQDALEPEMVRVIERWRDESAMTAHLQSAHLAQFMTFVQGVKLKSLTAKLYDATGERDLYG